MRTQIVVPCYNESARLDSGRFLRFLLSHRDIQFLFVNDGSRDGTGCLLERMKAAAAGVQVLHLSRNQGKAEAVRQGMARAMTSGMDAVGYWDADLATPLEAIPCFQDVLRRKAEVSIVLGCRLPLLGHFVERGWLRQRLGRVFALCASWVLGQPIYDTQCGAKLLRVEEGTRRLFAEPFLSRWIFDVEMLARWRLHSRMDGAADEGVYELPLEEWRQIEGSKLKPTDFIRAIGELWRIRRKYPMAGDGRGRILSSSPPARSVPAILVPPASPEFGDSRPGIARRKAG